MNVLDKSIFICAIIYLVIFAYSCLGFLPANIQLKHWVMWKHEGPTPPQYWTAAR